MIFVFWFCLDKQVDQSGPGLADSLLVSALSVDLLRAGGGGLEAAGVPLLWLQAGLQGAGGDSRSLNNSRGELPQKHRLWAAAGHRPPRPLQRRWIRFDSIRDLEIRFDSIRFSAKREPVWGGRRGHKLKLLLVVPYQTPQLFSQEMGGVGSGFFYFKLACPQEYKIRVSLLRYWFQLPCSVKQSAFCGDPLKGFKSDVQSGANSGASKQSHGIKKQKKTGCSINTVPPKLTIPCQHAEHTR